MSKLMGCVFLTVALVFQVNALANSSKSDFRDEKTLKLKNNLEVLIISDSGYEKSSVGLSIQVGAMHSPKQFQGLPHFIEHLLFFGGSKKHSETNYLRNLIQKNNGSMNASTYNEKTIFYYDIENGALAESLEVFGSQIAEPLFDAEFVKKEVESIDSEHKLDIDNDGWKILQLSMSIADEHHPRNIFTGGNRDTLQSIDEKIIGKFYETFYSANLMKLVVLSNLPISELEHQVRSSFSEIKNMNRILKKGPPAYSKDRLPLSIEMKSKQKDSLSLIFELPPVLSHWRSKPLDLIVKLVEQENQGSLIRYLVERDLIRSVKVWSEDLTSASYLFVEFELTDKGVSNSNDIENSFFLYMNMLKNNGLPRYVYDDYKKIEELKFASFKKRSDKSKARTLASAATYQPLKDLEKNSQLLTLYSPKIFKKLLENINPMNLIKISSNSRVKGDKIEPHYKTEYSIKRENKVGRNSVEPNIKNVSFEMKPKNIFIPIDIQLVNQESVQNKNLIDPKFGKILFTFDRTFQIPKVEAKIELRDNQKIKTALSKVKLMLLVEIIKIQMSPWLTSLSEVGDSIKIFVENDSLVLKISGYSQNFPLIVEEFFKKYMTLSVTEKDLNKAQSVLNSYLDSLTKSDLFDLNYELSKQILSNSVNLNEIILSQNRKNLISQIKTTEMDEFKSQFVMGSLFHGSIFGNIQSKKMEKLFANIPLLLKLKPHGSIFASSLHIPSSFHYQYNQNSESPNNMYWLIVPTRREN